MESEAKKLMGIMRGMIAQKQILSPDRWVNYGVMLTALLGDENDRYAELYQQAHKIQLDAILNDKTASVAEAEMKASEAYKELLKQKGLTTQIEEMIRLAKIRSTMANREFPLSEV